MGTPVQVNPGLKGADVTNGAAHVTISGGGIAHNRNIPAAATIHPGDDSTNTATWDSSEGVKNLLIHAIPSAGAAIQSDDKFLVVVNAPTAAIAKTWLEDSGSISQDVQYQVGYVNESTLISRSSVITRVDLLPLNGTTRFVVEAV